MSLEIEDQSLHDKPSEAFGASQKISKISYTRDFLLSLCELEICKSLPSGFDRSLLSEFEDTSHNIQERPRISGSLPLQGFRRGDYSSSPPTRGDSVNYSRGNFARWDSQSVGRGDKEGDFQSDWDSDSGRRYGNPSRRTWQNPDHDGLLGSGSFPRPSGYAAGTIASKARGDDHYQLKKSNEPYHPPRPYKAVPHTRKEINDSLNDETFGSTECTSEDRVEEERKRRASFELMRKEQLKVLQEKQNSDVDKHKDDIFSDDTTLLGQTKEVGALYQNNVLDGPQPQPVSNNDSGNNAFPSQTSAPRPLVPPGFASTILEKSSGPKPLNYTHDKEIGKQEIDERNMNAKAKPLQNGILKDQERQSVHEQVMSEQQPKDETTHAAFAKEGELIGNAISDPEVPSRLYGSSSILEANEDLRNGETIQPNINKVMRNNIVSDSNKGKSTSILEKLFGSPLAVNTSTNFSEPYDSKPVVTRSPNTAQSSKFSHWFVEEELKPADDLSSVGPSDLLSLIAGGERGGVQALDEEASRHVPPEIIHQGSELTNRLASTISLATTGVSEKSFDHNKVEAVPAVLTCADLEQKILSEYSENSSTLPPPIQNTSVSRVEMVQPKASVDNHASLHLLSLLKKKTDMNDMTSSPNIEIRSSSNILAPEVGDIDTVFDTPREVNAETLPNSGKNITLEALFGSAFMKELQSVEAPVSMHRNLGGSAKTDVFEPRELSIPVVEDGFFPSSTDKIGSNRRNYSNNILASNSEQKTKLEKVENWLGFEDPQIEVESLKLQSEGRLRHGFNGAPGVQLPEGESLIGDPLNPSTSIYMPSEKSNKVEFLSNTSFDVAEKLAALGAGFKDERPVRAQEGPRFVRGPYDFPASEKQYHDLHANVSAPQFPSSHMSLERPYFNPIDSHPANIASHMKFMAPESMKHDGRANIQIPVNMIRPPFHQPNNGPSGFDIPAQRQMLQQTQMPSNFPPNVLHEFLRGGPMPSHPSNQPNALSSELNLMQGFPFGQRQTDIIGLGMPLSAPDVSGRSNHPQALQRLFNMELRANPKQMHPFGVNSQGIHNNELDMGFRYR